MSEAQRFALLSVTTTNRVSRVHEVQWVSGVVYYREYTVCVMTRTVGIWRGLVSGVYSLCDDENSGYLAWCGIGSIQFV